MTLDEAKDYVKKVRWQYAKTYPKAPHEYTVLSWKPELQKEMVDFAKLIRQQGRDEYYYKKKFKVLDIDEYEYWTMDEVVYDTDLINRTFNDDDFKKELVEFTTSPLFVFERGMTLEDVRRGYEVYCKNGRA